MIYDYEELGLKCGLEIHQQLNSSTKLFCRCPNALQGTREPDFLIHRKMRPVLGEMGTYDKAMLTEYEKDMDVMYEGYNDVICTYELDETPPYSCNDEARKIAIEIALLLNSNIIEEMHVCRKNYLDGSVPCGFQRTMIIAKDGNIELKNGKKIGIDILCLEEDAARKSKTEKKTNYFRLDRLGIPLVEVTTKPDINDPFECRECAERLGLLLWTTNVKKVLGAIRQDVNVSIKKGTRIEIKGVQKLDWIPLLIAHEVSRQAKLLKIKEDLEKRKIIKDQCIEDVVDLTKLMKNKKKGFISKGIKAGKKLAGINIKNFKGIFGTELMPNYRFGTEISSKVKSITGLKGIIHSDEELKNYQFSPENINSMKKTLNSQEKDCFVLVLGTQKEIEKATKIIKERVLYAFIGVPPETRRALENGNSEFLRELHGGARLYPDTDSLSIINSEQEIEQVRKTLPAYPWETIENYSKKYDLKKRMIKDLIFTGKLDLFENLLRLYPENPTLIITTLLETITALRRDDKNVDEIKNEDFKEIFKLLKSDEIGKEAIEEILVKKADKPDLSIEQIKADLNLEKLSRKELKEIIDKIVNKNTKLIKEKEMRAMGALMGDVMKEARGKIDGAIVSKELKSILTKKIKELN